MEKLLKYLNEERGRRFKLAVDLKISPSSISMWKGKVPLDRLNDVSRLTGISMQELRPDFFNGEAA